MMNQMMNKTALITGATDGIGKAVALELAGNNYNVHIFGRNPERGEAVLNALKAVSPDNDHQLHLVDLATIEANNQFLDEYTAQNQKLDLLFLNALAFSKKLSVSTDGIETTFAVGYLSRYLFSIRLNPLLEQSENPRVIHNTNPSSFTMAEIQYGTLSQPDYGILRATAESYSASALLAYFINKRTDIKAKHEIVYPGEVNTKQIQGLNRVLRLLMRLRSLQEPEQVGEWFVKHITDTNTQDTSGRFFNKGNEKKIASKLTTSGEAYDRLIEFSEQVTGIGIDIGLDDPAV